MRRRQGEFILPKVGKDGKHFCVSYSCYNKTWDRMVRYKVFRGLKGIETRAEAEQAAIPIIEEYRNKLLAGWRPWDDEYEQYEDYCGYAHELNARGSSRNDKHHIRKLLSEFLISKSREVSSKTMESYRSKLRLFCLWLESNGHGDIHIYQLDGEIIREFFDYLINKKLDPRTIDKYQRNLNQFLKYCIERDYLKKSPMIRIHKPPKEKDLAARPLSNEHLRKLLLCVEKHDTQFFLACMFQFFLCCRPGNELRLMRLEDIDLSNHTVRIRQDTGKTGARVVTIPNALAEICEDYHLNAYPQSAYLFTRRNIPGPEPVGQNYFNRRFREFRERLNLPFGYKFYSLKHTAAGKLLESGATVVEVMNHLGHTDFESTIHYIKRHFGEKSEKVCNFRPEALKGII